MSLPTFNFLYITAGTGTSGSTGQQLATYWQSNFDLIKSLLMELDGSIANGVISDDIKQLKVVDGVAYYTTDGSTWVSLGPSFANLSGRVEDNQALISKFNNYTLTTSFNNLADRVEVLEDNQTDISGLIVDVDTLELQMNDPNTGVLARLTTLEDGKVSSSSIAEIRINSQQSYLEYRLIGGTTWTPITLSGSLNWTQITGNPSDNTDLVNLLGDYATELDLSAHIADDNNPHGVTKAQIGLEDVDNTSDADKPVSTFQKIYIDKINTMSLSSSEYEDSGFEVENNKLYNIIDINQ